MQREDLAMLFREAGLRSGDAVLVHSSLKALGPIEGGADAILDTLLEILTPEGLLAVPTHTWATVNDRQPVFHQLYSPSTVGILTNILRTRSGAVRSLHPTHSVAAMGSRAAAFCAGHENDDSPCSPTSPYGKLLAWRGKVVLLGVDLKACTFFHCLEEIAGLGDLWSLDPVRRTRYLIAADGHVVVCQSRAHQDHKSGNYDRVEGELLDAGVMTLHQRGPVSVRIVDAVKSRDYLVPRFRANPRFFW